MFKIIFVIGVMGKGGAERVIAAISNELVKSNFDIEIITIYGNRQDYYLDDRIKLCPIICKNRFRVLRPFERIVRLRKMIKNSNPDAVISFLADVNIHTIISMAGLSIPLIVSERNDPRQDPEYSWQRKMRDILYRKVDGFVFQTEDAANYFKDIIPQKSKQSIIPNPLTPNLPSYDYGIDNMRLITACRLNHQKNLKMMIDSVKIVREKGILCSLDIYGQGPLQNELDEYIRKNNCGGYIALKGFSNRIHDEMLESEGFLISSNYEGISNSMIEALAIGIPVIATDCPVGGARMYIEDHVSGWLIPVGDTVRFSNAIEELLTDKERSEKYGKEASKVRTMLDTKNITEKWEEFISSVIQNR